jgi:outer membrane protein TolC
VLPTHPVLLQTRLQLDSYQADLRWKKEQLKPELDINYNALNEPIGNNPFAAYSTRNYKWGVDLSFPVLLRKERGAVKLADLKVADYELELAAKQAAIEANAQNALLDWRLNTDLLGTVERMYSDARQLLEGEQNMFDNGESSLFMINTREMTAITSELKVIETKAKNQKAKLHYLHSLGLLAQ